MNPADTNQCSTLHVHLTSACIRLPKTKLITFGEKNRKSILDHLGGLQARESHVLLAVRIININICDVSHSRDLDYSVHSTYRHYPRVHDKSKYCEYSGELGSPKWRG